MKKGKLMKVTITFAVVMLVAGFVLTYAIAQGNGVGSQGSGNKGLQGNTSVQRGIMQQQKGLQNNIPLQGKNTNPVGQGNQMEQGNLNKTECNCDCECCLEEESLQEQIQQQLQEQKHSMLQSQELQQSQDDQLPLKQGNMYGNQNQINQMNQLMVEDCEYSVEISGQTLKNSTIEQIAAQWGIDTQTLLNYIVNEFGLNGNYNTKNILENLRQEYRFTPAQIKTIAENIKKTAQQKT